MMRGALAAMIAMLFTACGSPPALDSTPRAAAPATPQATIPQASPQQAAPQRSMAPAVTDSPPVVLSPRAPEASSPIEAKDAVEAAALKAALERVAPQTAGRAASEPTDPRASGPAAPASVPAETLPERELAAVRESLPALQQRMGQVIQRSFDAESFRRLLTNHPEFRKE